MTTRPVGDWVPPVAPHAPRTADRPAVLGTGQPLDADVRAALEPRFGQDFSQVRVHHDGAAASLSREARARAFTVGEDIAFANGQYRPDTRQGVQRIAHELAHVVQFRRGGVSEDAERRAGTAADVVAHGGTVDAHALGGAPRGLARDTDAATQSAHPDAAAHSAHADGATQSALPDEHRLSIASFAGFPPRSAHLTAAHRSTVAWLAPLVRSWLVQDLSVRLRVVGSSHAGKGDASLAMLRASAVARALRAAGVPPTAVTVDTADAAAPGGPDVTVVPETGARLSGTLPPPGASSLGPPPGGSWLPPRRPPIFPDPPALPRRPAPAAPPPGFQPVPPQELPRAGEVGDLRDAVLAMEWNGRPVGERITDHLQRRWGQLGTGGRIIVGSGAALFVAPIAVGAAKNAELRGHVLDFLDGTTIPLAPLADMKFRVKIPGTGVHLRFDATKLGPLPRKVIRGLKIRFQTRPDGALGLPDDTAEFGFHLQLDFAEFVDPPKRDKP